MCELLRGGEQDGCTGGGAADPEHLRAAGGLVGWRAEKAAGGGRAGRPGRGAGDPAVLRGAPEQAASGLLSWKIFQYPLEADGGQGGPGPAAGGLSDAVPHPDPPQCGGGPLGGPHPGPLQKSPGPGDGERHPAEPGAQFGPAAHHSTGGSGVLLRHLVQPPGVAGTGAAGRAGLRGGGGVLPGQQQPAPHDRHGEHRPGGGGGGGRLPGGPGCGGAAPPLAGELCAPPPEASPLPPPFRWRTGARWCPATSIPTKRP